MKKYLPSLLFILSIGFLIPGIIQPFMTIKAEMNKQALFDIATQEILPPAKQGNDIMQNIVRSVIHDVHFEGSLSVFESTRSLWAAMSDLMTHDYVIVGLLIALFGIIIPFIKIMLNLIALCLASGATRHDLLRISSLLSKWSMSDVFFMAIVVTFFTMNANAQELNVIQMSARFESGFYFFAIYCVLAIAASQLMQLWSDD